MSYIIGAATQFDLATRINTMAVPLFAPLAAGLDNVPNLPTSFKQKFKTRPIDALLDLASPIEDIIYEVNDIIVSKNPTGGKIQTPAGPIDLRSIQPDDANLDDSDRAFVRRVRGILIFMSSIAFIPEVLNPVLAKVTAEHVAKDLGVKVPQLPPLPFNLPSAQNIAKSLGIPGIHGFSIGIEPGTATVITGGIAGATTVTAAALPAATVVVTKAISDQTATARRSGDSSMQSGKPGVINTVTNAINEMTTGEKIAVGVGVVGAVSLTAYLLTRRK